MDITHVILVLSLTTLITAQSYFYPNLNPNQFFSEEIIPADNDDDLLTQQPIPYPNLNFPSGDYYEDFDINGNLISNTTNGFKPIILPRQPVYPSYAYTPRVHKVEPQVTLQNNSFSSPYESVHRHDSQMKNQTTIVVTHTIIRPKQKPKTIIEIFKDPSQSGENVTITDPENNVFEFNTSLVNSFSKPTERAEPRGSLWFFGGSRPSTTPMPLDEDYIRQSSQESTDDVTTTSTTTESSAENQEPLETNNSASQGNADDENGIKLQERSSNSDEGDENDDYDDQLQQDQNHVHNKTYAKVPIWIRNKYLTTPKILSFDPRTTTAKPVLDLNSFLWYRPQSSTEGVQAITLKTVGRKVATEEPKVSTTPKPFKNNPWSFFK